MTLVMAGFLLGCSTYEIEVRGQPSQGSLSDTPIVHCMRSLGFEDRSAELVPAALAEHPTLVAAWVTTAGNQGWLAETPHATALVFHSADRWRVRFDAKEDASSFFADTFSLCISLHDRELFVETRVASDTDPE